MFRVLIESEPAVGAWNMAVDEVLLESAIRRGWLTLRIYQWSEPTLSLGYFQSADDPLLIERFGGLSRVRRLSGGGALLHHHEITYSLACPADEPPGESPSRLYDAAHQAIVDLLRSWNVPAAVRGAVPDRPQPFLCFGRGDARDIVLHGFKIVGSAQRRRRGAVLQHGALLLERSPYAPEFPGLFDLQADSRREQSAIREQLGSALSAVTIESCGSATLTAEEHRDAEYLAAGKYASAAEFLQRSRSIGGASPD